MKLTHLLFLTLPIFAQDHSPVIDREPEVQAHVLTDQPISLAKNHWAFTVEYGRTTLYNSPSGALYFSFPTTIADSVNYLQTLHTTSIAAYHSISITLQTTTTGSPVFNYEFTGDPNPCNFPAHARLMIETDGTGSAAGYDRWWANPTAFLLDPSNTGLVVMTVMLTPNQWSSVFGEFGNSSAKATSGFKTALARVRWLGLTFGGGCFFGHGVDVLGTGTAKLTISAFDLF